MNATSALQLSSLLAQSGAMFAPPGSPQAQFAANQVANNQAAAQAFELKRQQDEAEKKKKQGLFHTIGQVAGTALGSMIPGVGPIVGPAIGGALGGQAGTVLSGGKFNSTGMLVDAATSGLTNYVGGKLMGSGAGTNTTELGADSATSMNSVNGESAGQIMGRVSNVASPPIQGTTDPNVIMPAPPEMAPSVSATGGGWGGVGRSLVAQAPTILSAVQDYNRPTSTIPTVSPQSASAMGPGKTSETIGMLGHQADRDAQQAWETRIQNQKLTEAEKDRKQHLDLQMLNHKNNLSELKFKSEIENERSHIFTNPTTGETSLYSLGKDGEPPTVTSLVKPTEEQIQQRYGSKTQQMVTTLGSDNRPVRRAMTPEEMATGVPVYERPRVDKGAGKEKNYLVTTNGVQRLASESEMRAGVPIDQPPVPVQQPDGSFVLVPRPNAVNTTVKQPAPTHIPTADNIKEVRKGVMAEVNKYGDVESQEKAANDYAGKFNMRVVKDVQPGKNGKPDHVSWGVVPAGPRAPMPVERIKMDMSGQVIQ